ncbi:MAG: sterol carrier protein domain-containing protein, partial [Actinomycetes bacterium]
YGPASHALSMTVPRDPDALRADAPHDPGLRLRLVPVEDWKPVADLYDAVTRTRPGMIARNDGWHLRAARDEPSLREGRSALRCVVAEDDKGVRGYARYATKPDWAPTGPHGKVHVREVIAGDAAARAALYRYLFDLDLMGTTELENVPVDDPLLHWLTNIRTASPTLGDALYVRLVDLPAALAQRTYSTTVDVVLDVTDDLCPWNAGRWRLRGNADGAQCSRTDDDPDVAVPVTVLGAAYLGGTSLAGLAAAGQVQVRRDGALEPVSAAFSGSPAPWCPFVF